MKNTLKYMIVFAVVASSFASLRADSASGKPKKIDQASLEFVSSGNTSPDGYTPLATVFVKTDRLANRIIPGRVTVKLKRDYTGQSASELRAFFASRLNLSKILSVNAPYADMLKLNPRADIYGLSNVFVIAYADSLSPLEIQARLKNRAEFEYSEPVLRKEFLFVPNDSLLSWQWAVPSVKLESAWDITRGADSVLIAIVDSELDTDHEDIAPRLWFNPGETGLDAEGRDKRTNGIDDDGNGKIDDYCGWDFAGNTTADDEKNGIIREDNDTKIRDINSKYNHGTFVAGSASAQTDNKIGVAGTCPECKLLPVKIRSDYGILFRGHEGILYASLLGAKIINCSWTGIGETPSEREVVKTAAALGSLIVAGAGNTNDYNDMLPVIYNNMHEVLFAGATDPEDSVSNFSSYGKSVGVFAPGRNVETTEPYDQYMQVTGTSLSSPITAGVCGLIKTIHPDFDSKQIYAQIRSTADSITFGKAIGKREMYFGKLNAASALTLNKSFAEGNRTPGILFDSASIRTFDGTVNSYNDLSMKVYLKNYLAPASNVRITIISDDDLVEIKNSAVFPAMRTGEGVTAEFTVRATPKSYWYDKLSTATIIIQADGYENYAVLYLPMNLPPAAVGSISMNFADSLPRYFGGSHDFKITSVSAPSIHKLWICGYRQVDTSVFVCNLSDNDAGKFYFLPDSLKCFPAKICAVDENTALMILPVNTYFNYLMISTDGGQTWQQTNRTSDFGSISDVEFFDHRHGLLLGADKLNPRRHLLETFDGGKNWRPAIDFPFLRDDEYLFTDKMNIFRSEAVTVTDVPKFCITRNAAGSWDTLDFPKKAYVTAFSARGENKLSLVYESLEPEDLNGIIFRSAYLNPSGTDWTILPRDLSPMVSSSCVVFASSLNDESAVIIDEMGKAVATKDEMQNWFPVYLSPELQTVDAGIRLKGTYVRDGMKTRVWLAGDAVYWFDIDEFFPPANPDKVAPIVYDCLYPNPVGSDNAVLQLYAVKDSDIEIEIFDMLGNRKKTVAREFCTAFVYRTYTIPTGDMAQGTYIVRIKAGGETLARQLKVLR